MCITGTSNNWDKIRQLILNKYYKSSPLLIEWKMQLIKGTTILKRLSKQLLIDCCKKRRLWRFNIWLLSFITSLMNCMNKVLIMLWLKVQIENKWKKKLNIEFQRDGQRVSINMISSTLIFIIKRTASKTKEERSTDQRKWPNTS